MIFSKNKIPQLLLILILLFTLTNSHAQGNGRLSGKVVDRSTQMPLAGISVVVQGAPAGMTTDSSGSFRFTNLEIKTYNIDFTGVGYNPQSRYNIVVGAGNETNLTIELEPATESLT
ncbi:MAG: carboxypeptidase-like regulatory domain-containing protein, partial [Chitinophagaceae bacterium]